MNFLELILKQLRQRLLSTILTALSITLGVGLAIAILVLHREGQQVFGQNDFGYEVIAGVKGSGLQLVVNTVYHIDASPGNIKYSVYENLTKQRMFHTDVKQAIPQSAGDTYRGLPIVATVAQFFGYDSDGKRIENTQSDPNRRFEYRPGQSFEIADGRILNDQKYEAVIGADVTARTGLKVGDSFKATHGQPQAGQPPEEHNQLWKVVGLLAPTHTAADHCVWIGLTSFYTIPAHASAELKREIIRRGGNPATHLAEDDEEKNHFTVADDGTIHLDQDVLDAREVSAILIKTRGGFNAMNLMFNLNLQPDVMAISPAIVMRDFFSNFLNAPVTLLLVISALVTVVAAVGILTTIYNSVSARGREIAILRALGATRTRILLLVTCEAALLGAIGGVLGLVLGHLLCGAGSAYLAKTLGESINWLSVGRDEIYYLISVVIVAFIAGLVPALKAYRTPVATNLAAQ